ncbi:hypothetical protein CK203_051709 [Vitis vinifera]|uniref:Uncharacterized protein n=1 Tax=Vitis vinifera TaxID=29760 RepID=A0A438H563_VITVI|nr:hypothetical protein CK203_051709 [Vitis vinifera]
MLKTISTSLVWKVVKGAPRLRAARRHPPAPRLKAGDAPSRSRRLGVQGARLWQGATWSLGTPRSLTSFFSFSSSSASGQNDDILALFSLPAPFSGCFQLDTPSKSCPSLSRAVEK